MRDGYFLVNVNRAAHREQSIICASNAVLSGVSLMAVAEKRCDRHSASQVEMASPHASVHFSPHVQRTRYRTHARIGAAFCGLVENQ
jgi:hypothetical protein